MAVQTAAKATKTPRSHHGSSAPESKMAQRNSLRGALHIAEQNGLLQGRRTLVVRGRMPEKLVIEARRKTGITSDSRLLETALANLAVADDYAEWLFSQRGTVDSSLDLEF